MALAGLGTLPARAGRPRAVNVGDAERGLSALAGAGLIALALSRRSAPSTWIAAAAGAALLARGATGRSAVYGALGRSTALPAPVRRPIEVARAITIGARPEQIRAALRRPEVWLVGGPIESVSAEGDRFELTIHALGLRIADLTVELRQDSEDTLHLGARRGGDGRLHEGRIRFAPAPGDQGTEMHVAICIHPESALAAALSRALEGIAERALGRALQNLRQLIEAGEVARADVQAHGRRGLLTRTVKKAGTRREAAA